MFKKVTKQEFVEVLTDPNVCSMDYDETIPCFSQKGASELFDYLRYMERYNGDTEIHYENIFCMYHQMTEHEASETYGTRHPEAAVAAFSEDGGIQLIVEDIL